MNAHYRVFIMVVFLWAAILTGICSAESPWTGMISQAEQTGRLNNLESQLNRIEQALDQICRTQAQAGEERHTLSRKLRSEIGEVSAKLESHRQAIIDLDKACVTLRDKQDEVLRKHNEFAKNVRAAAVANAAARNRRLVEIKAGQTRTVFEGQPSASYERTQTYSTPRPSSPPAIRYEACCGGACGMVIPRYGW